MAEDNTDEAANDRVVRISYRGGDAEAAARELTEDLRAHGIDAGDPDPAPVDGGRLGVAEVLVVMVLTAAGKAVATTLLDLLETRVKEWISPGRKPPRVRVVVESGSDRPRQHPLDLQHIQQNAIAGFFKQLKETVSKL